MPTTPAEKRRIYRWVELWRARLMLSTWSVNIEFSETPREDDPAPFADVTAKHRYSEMSIVIYPRFWQEAREVQQRVLMHEMIHCVTDRVHNLIERRVAKRRVTEDEKLDAVENLTETITNIVWAAYVVTCSRCSRR